MKSLLFLVSFPFLFASVFAQPRTNSLPHVLNDQLYTSNEPIIFLYEPLRDSLKLVYKNTKYGIIDSSDQLVVPFMYDEISLDFSFRELLLQQKRYLNDYFYQYWQDGNESEEEYARLLELELNRPESCLNLVKEFRLNPLFVARKGNKWGVINKLNKIIIPFDYISLQEIGQDIFVVRTNVKYGIIDSDGKTLLSQTYDTIIPLPVFRQVDYMQYRLGAYALLIQNKKYGAINLGNRRVIEPKYDNLEHCFHAPEYDCICGFSPEGNLHSNLIPRKGYEVHSFGNALKFQNGTKYGLLNIAEMEEITPSLYDSIYLYYSSRYSTDEGVIVTLNDKYSFLTHDSRHLHPNVYDSVSMMRDHSRNRFFKVENDGFVGVFDKNGNKYLNIEWDNVLPSQQVGFSSICEFIVERDGKFGVVNSEQKKVIPVKYDSIIWERDAGSNYYVLIRNGKAKKIRIDDR